VASGNKYQSETDFSGSLSFVRSYNSSNLVDLNLGKGWSSAYQKRLIVSTNYLTLVNGAGRGEPWRKINSVWVGDADSDFIVTENTAGYTIDKQNGDTEEYDSEGQMMSETDSQGRQTTFAYDANSRLIQVTDHFGLNLDLAYDTNGHLESVTDANNATYQYEYDVNDNLIGVVYPDLTPADDSDNAKRVYHYENSNFPNHLTGVTDENGDRFAIYAYDENGKAILTEHAQTTGAVGQEQFQLDFQGQ
jgi:YD repeat-containing protein